MIRRWLATSAALFATIVLLIFFVWARWAFGLLVLIILCTSRDNGRKK